MKDRAQPIEHGVMGCMDCPFAEYVGGPEVCTLTGNPRKSHGCPVMLVFK